MIDAAVFRDVFRELLQLFRHAMIFATFVVFVVFPLVLLHRYLPGLFFSAAVFGVAVWLTQHFDARRMRRMGYDLRWVRRDSRTGELIVATGRE